MFGFFTRFQDAYSKLWLELFRRKRPDIRIGRGVRFKGIPIFSMDRDSRVIIGDHVTFDSRQTSNLVGLCRPCSVAAMANSELAIGDHCGFSAVAIYCAKEIRIGSRLTCGGNVSIWDTDFHPLDAQARGRRPQGAPKTAPIIIGDDVFIGANCIVLKGVDIGDRVVIGAGSVVTKSIPADEIWAGNPARPIRRAPIQV